MSIARKRAGCAVVSNNILVIGGDGSDEAGLRAVECYDKELNSWFAASPLPEAIRKDVTPGVFNGLVYVLGICTNHILKYSIQEDKWTTVSENKEISRNISKSYWSPPFCTISLNTLLL